MFARIGLVLSRVFERTAPEPFTLAVLLAGLTAVLAWALGGPAGGVDGNGGAGGGVGWGVVSVLDAWRSAEAGLWQFLGFGMQMCLVLVTGHALASSGPVRAGLRAFARLPRGAASAAGLVALGAMALGLVNWGLGLIGGALLARAVWRSMAERGVACHGPLLAAAGYSGMMVWHGGLSGSAPLKMTTRAEAADVLPASLAAAFPDGVPLDRTIFSPLNLVVTAGMVAIGALVFALMSPRDASGCGPMGRSAEADRGPHDGQAPLPQDGPGTIPDRLDRSRLLAGLLAAGLAAAAWRTADVGGALRLGLNEVNAAMLAAGLVLHGSLRAYGAAAEAAARGCAGIILQFPIYGGIAGMMAASGLIDRAAGLVAWAGPVALPAATMLSAGVVNLFVPSGGGQWAIQGPLALEAGAAAGVDPGTMIMAVAYGDQLTNMLQPFWALPLLAITGCRAREIVGYTSVAMLAAGAWMLVCLVVMPMIA